MTSINRVHFRLSNGINRAIEFDCANFKEFIPALKAALYQCGGEPYLHVGLNNIWWDAPTALLGSTLKIRICHDLSLFYEWQIPGGWAGMDDYTRELRARLRGLSIEGVLAEVWDWSVLTQGKLDEFSRFIGRVENTLINDDNQEE